MWGEKIMRDPSHDLQRLRSLMELASFLEGNVTQTRGFISSPVFHGHLKGLFELAEVFGQ